MALLYQISHFSKSTANKIPDDISILQIWNKPRVQGITPEPVMSCRVVKVKSEVAQESGRARSDHISSSLYEARREASLCNNNTLLSACQKSLAEENVLYGITYMATPDNKATCYVKTKMANHVPVGSVLSYQLALTEADFQVELNEVSMNRFLCKSNCVLTTGVYPKFPINEI